MGGSPFIGGITMFAGNFAPRSFAFCDGQLLAISQNDALFSLLGTIYGGDGRTTFGLPDLRGRVPIHQGQGPGLTNRRIGQRGGAEIHTLSVNEMPSHTHHIQADGGKDESQPFLNNLFDNNPFFTSDTPNTALASGAISFAGGNQYHTNLAPFLVMNFIISLQGIYPSRN